MPGLDGLQLQEKLSQIGTSRPIIFLTGNGDVPTSVRAMKAGAIDFLTKPVNRDQLLSAITRALEWERSIGRTGTNAKPRTRSCRRSRPANARC